MLLQVDCLKEIVSSIPNTKRKFHVENDIMGINPGKVLAARTFDGIILSDKIGQAIQTETPAKFIEIFFEGGATIVTILTNKLQYLLFGVVNDWNGGEKEPLKENTSQEGPTLSPYSEYKKVNDPWN